MQSNDQHAAQMKALETRFMTRLNHLDDEILLLEKNIYAKDQAIKAYQAMATNRNIKTGLSIKINNS